MAAARVQPSQPAPNAQTCDLCHLKPKFGNHQYCSKTCAAQAATLCNQCHKKPKFQNFDYCGKYCASLAAANGTKPNRQAGTTTKKGSNPNNTQQPGAGTIDPMQIAQLVAQHVPQIASLLSNVQGQGSAASTSTGAQLGGAQTSISNTLPNSMTSATTQASQTTSGIRSMSFFLRGKKKAQPQLNVSTKQASDDSRCIIPGCKQPVHVDEEGSVSLFCSLRHREEAVTSGLMSPCIMCLVLPQSDSDYFCSKACREESMNKTDSEDEELPSPVESQD